MKGVRHKFAELVTVMKYNAAEYSARSGRTPTSMANNARPQRITEKLLRGLREPETWDVSYKTLSQIEAAYEDSEHWPGQGGAIWREVSGDDGYVLRRPIGNWRSDKFADVIDAWRQAREGGGSLEYFDDFDNVSIIDASADNPDHFLVYRHSRQSVRIHNGTSLSGVPILKSGRPPFYIDAYLSDLTGVKLRNEPELSELIWTPTANGKVAYFYRLILPFQPYLLSVLIVLRMTVSDDRSVSSIRLAADA